MLTGSSHCVGQNACKPCTTCKVGFEPFGKGCTITADQQCTACPAGKAKEKEGSAKCAACAAGRYQGAAGPCGGPATCLPHTACLLLAAVGVIAGIMSTLAGRQRHVQRLHAVRQGRAAGEQRKFGCDLPGPGRNPKVAVCAMPRGDVQTGRGLGEVHQVHRWDVLCDWRSDSGLLQTGLEFA